MADLFTNAEFAAYLQVTEASLATATVNLARDWATSRIRRAIGAAVYDALDDSILADLKFVALAVAGRIYLNPRGIRSQQVDDYQVTYAAETIGGADLTAAERDLVRHVAGVSSAFTVVPNWPTTPAVSSESW
jgi:hypothetical protein